MFDFDVKFGCKAKKNNMAATLSFFGLFFKREGIAGDTSWKMIVTYADGCLLRNQLSIYCE